MKKFAQKNHWKMFLETIYFAFEKTFFRVSVEFFLTALHDIIGLHSHCLSANRYPELRFEFYFVDRMVLCD